MNDERRRRVLQLGRDEATGIVRQLFDGGHAAAFDDARIESEGDRDLLVITLRVASTTELPGFAFEYVKSFWDDVVPEEPDDTVEDGDLSEYVHWWARMYVWATARAVEQHLRDGRWTDAFRRILATGGTPQVDMTRETGLRVSAAR